VQQASSQGPDGHPGPDGAGWRAQARPDQHPTTDWRAAPAQHDSRAPRTEPDQDRGADRFQRGDAGQRGGPHPERRPDYRRERDIRLGLHREAGADRAAGHDQLVPLPAADLAGPGWIPSADGLAALGPGGPAGQPETPAYQLVRADHGGSAGLPPPGPADHADYRDGVAQHEPAARAPVDEDAEPTTPLPVILPGATPLPRPAPVEAPRGFFEPARPTRSASVTGSVEPPPPAERLGAMPPANPSPAGLPAGDPLGGPVPQAANAELEQIKDLYLTAEAIGEDALDKHFDQVSRRQRELIREFFDRSQPGAGS
jgi:hypothetical protein